MAFSYIYSEAADFPGAPSGQCLLWRMVTDIQASTISTPLDLAVTSHSDDVVTLAFDSELSPADKTTLDGDTTGPAGGLIAAHDPATPQPPIFYAEDDGPYATNSSTWWRVFTTDLPGEAQAWHLQWSMTIYSDDVGASYRWVIDNPSTTQLHILSAQPTHEQVYAAFTQYAAPPGGTLALEMQKEGGPASRLVSVKDIKITGWSQK